MSEINFPEMKFSGPSQSSEIHSLVHMLVDIYVDRSNLTQSRCGKNCELLFFNSIKPGLLQAILFHPMGDPPARLWFTEQRVGNWWIVSRWVGIFRFGPESNVVAPTAPVYLAPGNKEEGKRVDRGCNCTNRAIIPMKSNAGVNVLVKKGDYSDWVLW